MHCSLKNRVHFPATIWGLESQKAKSEIKNVFFSHEYECLITNNKKEKSHKFFCITIAVCLCWQLIIITKKLVHIIKASTLGLQTKGKSN